MLVGIHKSVFGKNWLLRSRVYKEILSFNGICCIDLDINDEDFWDRVATCDLFIFRWFHSDSHMQIAQAILPVIENQMKIKCFPDQYTCWHFDDKIKQFFLLKSQGYPIIDCRVFWDKGKALNWAESAIFPMIFKLRTGAGSSNVVLLKRKRIAKRLIKRMFGKGAKSSWIPFSGNVRFHNFQTLFKSIVGPYYYRFKGQTHDKWNREKDYVLFQQYLPGNGFDTRVTTIGNRAFAFRRFNRKNDFRSSGSGLIDHDPFQINLSFVKKALEISNKLGFQTMAFDFLYGENEEPRICEISYAYDEKSVWKCHGYWDETLTWHEGHFWPQYFHLMDALGMEEMKQPEIKE